MDFYRRIQVLESGPGISNGELPVNSLLSLVPVHIPSGGFSLEFLDGKRYRGSFVYDVSAAGAESLESIAVSTGRLIALTGTGGTVSFESDGFITDHLGNVAAVVNLSAPASTPTDRI